VETEAEQALTSASATAPPTRERRVDKVRLDMGTPQSHKGAQTTSA
jgi:hypothetical protein